MALPILNMLARGDDPSDGSNHARIASEWGETVDDAQSCPSAALARTGPLALAFLDPGREPALIDAARRIAQLTHPDDDSGDAVVLWCLAIREGILRGRLDMETQISWLPQERRARWHGLVAGALADDAEAWDGAGAAGGVLAAFCCALAAVAHSATAREAIERAVLDPLTPDVIAATAGSLAGAVYGGASIPDEWTEGLGLWMALTTTTTLTADDFASLADAATQPPDHSQWAGDDAAMVVERLTHGVVARHVSSARTRDFTTTDEMRDWLNECAVEASSSARFEVFAGGEWRDRTVPARLVSVHFHDPDAPGGIPASCVDAAPVEHHTIPFMTHASAQRWFEIGFTPTYSPSMTARFDGSQLIALHSDLTLDPDTLRSGMAPSRRDDETDWWFVGFVGGNTVLMIPREDGEVMVEFDDDGADAHVESQCVSLHDELLRREAAFGGDWWRWLDDDLVLTDGELAAGVARAEAFARARIAAEEQ